MLSFFRQKDKQLHFFAGLAISVLVTIFMTYFLIGTIFSTAVVSFVVAMAIGLAKEVLDLMGYGTPEVLDFVATAIGGAVGSLGLYVIILFLI